MQRPLDATSYRDKPCELFSDEQARGLGYIAGRPMVSDDDSYCARNEEAKPDSQFFVWYYANGSRFAKIHRGEAETAYDWTVGPVAGQPALRAASSDRCYLAVALTDTQTLEIRIEDDKVTPCDRATQVAEAIVRKLGG